MTPASLPRELEALLALAIKRARLRRSEREDVARELRSHFQSALDDGRSIDDIARAFGDPRAAGRLIGRAKRRCRGLAWHAWVWSCRGVAALFALVLVTYGWAAWAYYGAEPTITRNYLKEINDPIRALDPSECALPEYEAVYWAIPKEDRERMLAAFTARPVQDEWQDRDWAIERVRPMLDRIRRASALPHLGYVLSGGRNGWPAEGPVFEWSRDDARAEEESETPMLHVLLPAIPTLRFWSRALEAEAIARWDAGDVAGAVADVSAWLSIALHQDEPRVMVTNLIAHAEGALVAHVVRERLANHPEAGDVADLTSMAHAMGRFRRALGGMPVAFERQGAMDTIQRSYGPEIAGVSLLHEDGIALVSVFEGYSEGDVVQRLGTMMPEIRSVVLPGAAMTMATRAETERVAREYFDGIEYDASRKPWELESFEGGTVDALLSDRASRWRHWFVLNFLPAYSHALRNTWRNRAEMDATIGVLAAERFRREHSRWPASWDELVPSYLPEAPIDMFDGKPLRMVERDGVWFIYSVGVDRKDDGGRIPVGADGTHQPDAAAGWVPRESFAAFPEKERLARIGDWILWPPIDPDTGEFIYMPRAEGPR